MNTAYASAILDAAELEAIEARARADLAEDAKYTDEDWKRIHASLDVEYRAKYKNEAAEYRRKFGEEPTLGTLMAAEMRAECNDHTEEERAANIAYAMAIINASPARPHATRHTNRR